MTAPPPDPFGARREGQGQPSGRPQWDSSGADGGQPWYGQQYGRPVQAHGAPRAWQGETRTEVQAVVALVCAIAAWVVLPVLPAIAALMIGRTARQEIARSGGRLTGDGLVTAAKVVAWANLVLSVLAVLFLVLVLGLLTVSASGLRVG